MSEQGTQVLWNQQGRGFEEGHPAPVHDSLLPAGAHYSRQTSKLIILADVIPSQTHLTSITTEELRPTASEQVMVCVPGSKDQKAWPEGEAVA